MLDKLPAEILLLIAEKHISDEITLNALARTSTWCYKNVDEVLYKHNVKTTSHALHWGASHNSPNTITKALEAGAKVDGLWNSMTPLMYAVFAHNLEVAKLLLEREADPNVINSLNQSALDYVDIAPLGRYWDYLPSEYPIRMRSHMSPVQLKIVELLLQHGTYPTIPDSYSETILCRAISSRDPKLIELLLCFGVHKDPAYERGMSPLSMAMGLENVNKRIFDLRPARLLLQYGAPANETPGEFWGPIGVTAKCGNTEGLQLLLEYGVDLNTFDSEGNTPLQVAITGRKIEYAHAIIKAGALTEIDRVAFPNRPRSAMSTPLQMAVENRDIELCRAILDHDPDPHVREVFANLEFNHYDDCEPKRILAIKGLSAKRVKLFMLAEMAKRRDKAAKTAKKARLEELKKRKAGQSSEAGLCKSFEAGLRL